MNESHACVTMVFVDDFVRDGPGAAVTLMTRGTLSALLLLASVAVAAIGMAAVRFSVGLLGAAAGATLAVYTPDWHRRQCTSAVLTLFALSLTGAGLGVCLVRVTVGVAGFAMSAFFAATVFRAFPGLDAVGPAQLKSAEYAGWHLVPFWVSVLGAGAIGAVALARSGDRTLGHLVAVVGGCGAASAVDMGWRSVRGSPVSGYGILATAAGVSLAGVAVQECRRSQRDAARARSSHASRPAD